MPLLRRQPFVKQKPPPDLTPDEEVFHCKLTNEIFRDYDQFFERIILCNSLVWTCSLTGKAGLTYQEAIESEESARKRLSSFPDYLQRPVLYLTTLTHRSRLNDLNDDVFGFARDRYFVGELVEVVLEGDRVQCRILKVQPPDAKAVNGDDYDSDSDSDVICLDDPLPAKSPKGKSPHKTKTPKKSASKDAEKNKTFGLDPSLYRYVVQEVKKGSSMHVVDADHISRKKGLFTRDKSKLYLKQHCDPEGDGVWKVKARYIKKFKLEESKFDDFFAGPRPAFAVSKVKKKPRKKDSVIDLTGEDEAIKKLKGKRGRPKKSKDEKQEKKKKKTKGKNKSNIDMQEVVKRANMSAEEKAAYKEQIKAAKEACKAEAKKRLEEEKLKRKEEREQEKEKKREEKRLMEEKLREWNRPREDMECDDLKDLPKPTPVNLGLQGNVFGDLMVILEYLNSFSSLFDMHTEFPEGIDLKNMTKALTASEVNGLFFDVLKFLLTSIFYLNEEENEEVQEEDLQEGLKNLPDNIEGASSSKAYVHAATVAAQWPQLNYGTALSKLHLDSFTISEILRLHFLSSGAKGSETSIRFRYQQRGGYTSCDDAGLEFRRDNPEIIKHLAQNNVFDLDPENKLKVLVALVNQLLTYVSCRDLIDDNYDKLRQLRYDLKQKQAAELRREKDETQFWYRKRLEEKAKDREAKKKAREDQLRIEELKKQSETEGTDLQSLLQAEGLSLNPTPQSLKEDKEEKEKSREPSPAPERRSTRQKEVKDREMDFEDIPDENIDWEKVTAEEKARWRRKFLEKERELSVLMSEVQSGYAIHPIGRDRTFRRYWIFHHLSGLFVEDNEEFIPDDFLSPVQQKNENKKSLGDQLPLTSKNLNQSGEDKNTSSDKENEVDGSVAKGGLASDKPLGSSDLNSQSRLVPDEARNGVTEKDENGGEKLSTQTVFEQISLRNKIRWSYFSRAEEIEVLISSLNPRGFREGPLRQGLIEQKARLVDSLSSCPVHQLNVALAGDTQKDSKTAVRYQSLKSRNKAIQGAVKNSSAEELLELNLRETLLDLEERIYNSSLGLLKIKNRGAWRDAIENGNYDAQADITWPGKLGVSKVNGDTPMEVDDEAVDEDDDDASPVVSDMAKALLQIGWSVERKYLTPPLGEDEDSKKSKQKGKTSKNKDKTCTPTNSDNESDDEKSEESHIERWAKSLANCTSLSQVFLHTSTLDSSIAWSKSALHARCRICRRKGDGEHMLLCDSCDRGHHMYCLKPAVKHIPKGDWFCPDCRPKEVMRTPRKQRRKSVMEESEEESRSSEEEEEDDSSEDEENSSEEEEEDDSEEEDSDEQDSDEEDDEDEEEEEEDDDEEEEEEKEPPKIKFLRSKKQQSSSGRSTPTSVRSGRTSRQNTPKETSPVESRPSRSRRTSPDTSFEQPAKRGRSSIEKPTSRQSLEKMKNPRQSLEKNGNTRQSLEKNAKPIGRSRSQTKLSANNDPPRPAKRGKEKDSEDDVSPAKKVATKSRGSEQSNQMKICEKLVMELAEHDDAWPFLTPVLRKEVPDYYEIIKKPMDFQTIKVKINKLEYQDPTDILEDLRLIFANCEQYNVSSAEEYKAGQRLCCFFVKQVKALKLDVILAQKAAQDNSDRAATDSKTESSPGVGRRSSRRT